MNDVLNFKSITTYRVALPLKFEFKTAKGTVRVRICALSCLVK